MKCAANNVSDDEAITRWVSPPLNTRGSSTLYIIFHHMFTYYSPGTTVLIQSSPDGINWYDEQWSYSSSNHYDTRPEQIGLTINHVNSTGNTYIAFTVRGDLLMLHNWCIDEFYASNTPLWASPSTDLLPTDHAVNVSVTPYLSWVNHGHTESVYLQTL